MLCCQAMPKHWKCSVNGCWCRSAFLRHLLMYLWCSDALLNFDCSCENKNNQSLFKEGKHRTKCKKVWVCARKPFLGFVWYWQKLTFTVRFKSQWKRACLQKRLWELCTFVDCGVFVNTELLKAPESESWLNAGSLNVATKTAQHTEI